MTSEFRYKGDYKNGVKEGQGQFWWTSGPYAGDKYIGGFFKDRRHGRGQYVYGDNNAVFDGEWFEGHQHGEGQIKFANGNILRGSWTEGKRNGNFLFINPNGDQYSATFEAGTRLANWQKL